MRLAAVATGAALTWRGGAHHLAREIAVEPVGQRRRDKQPSDGGGGVRRRPEPGWVEGLRARRGGGGGGAGARLGGAGTAPPAPKPRGRARRGRDAHLQRPRARPQRARASGWSAASGSVGGNRPKGGWGPGGRDEAGGWKGRAQVPAAGAAAAPDPAGCPLRCRRTLPSTCRRQRLRCHRPPRGRGRRGAVPRRSCCSRRSRCCWSTSRRPTPRRRCMEGRCTGAAAGGAAGRARAAAARRPPPPAPRRTRRAAPSAERTRPAAPAAGASARALQRWRRSRGACGEGGWNGGGTDSGRVVSWRTAGERKGARLPAGAVSYGFAGPQTSHKHADTSITPRSRDLGLPHLAGGLQSRPAAAWGQGEGSGASQHRRRPATGPSRGGAAAAAQAAPRPRRAALDAGASAARSGSGAPRAPAPPTRAPRRAARRRTARRDAQQGGQPPE
jgi:hypothetical protein